MLTTATVRVFGIGLPFAASLRLRVVYNITTAALRDTIDDASTTACLDRCVVDFISAALPPALGAIPVENPAYLFVECSGPLVASLEGLCLSLLQASLLDRDPSHLAGFRHRPGLVVLCRAVESPVVTVGGRRPVSRAVEVCNQFTRLFTDAWFLSVNVDMLVVAATTNIKGIDCLVRTAALRGQVVQHPSTAIFLRLIVARTVAHICAGGFVVNLPIQRQRG